MKAALRDVVLFRAYASLGDWAQAPPDATTISRPKLQVKCLVPQVLRMVKEVPQVKGPVLRRSCAAVKT